MARFYKLTKYILLVLIFVISSHISSAVPVVDINISQSFNEGDIVKFSYTFLSSQNENIEYVASVNCPGSQEYLLNLKQAILSSNELFYGEYVYGVVDENIKSGNCLASISIFEPYRLEFNKIFEVTNVNEFSIAPLICKNSSCIEKTKVFLSREKIYLNYTSSVEVSWVKAVLTFPDLSTKELVLPASIDADKIGSYSLEISAQKEGYKNASVTEQFAVIEDDLHVTEGLTQNNSTVENKLSSYLIFWIIGAVLLLVIAITLFYLRRKNRL